MGLLDLAVGLVSNKKLVIPVALLIVLIGDPIDNIVHQAIIAMGGTVHMMIVAFLALYIGWQVGLRRLIGG
jgi:hypothetical protein